MNEYWLIRCVCLSCRDKRVYIKEPPEMAGHLGRYDSDRKRAHRFPTREEAKAALRISDRLVHVRKRTSRASGEGQVPK